MHHYHHLRTPPNGKVTLVLPGEASIKLSIMNKSNNGLTIKLHSVPVSTSFISHLNR